MQKVKMSLHRIIAEIKRIESRQHEIHGMHFVTVADAKKQTAIGSTEEAIAKIQSNIDSVMDDFNKLVALKAARNLTNATHHVEFMGKKMTIDQVLAHRASISMLENMVATYSNQFAHSQNHVNAQNQKIAAMVNQQIETIAGKQNKFSEVEAKMISDSIHAIHKIEMVNAPNVSLIDKCREMIKQFQSELDFVLVEANAKIEVEVSW